MDEYSLADRVLEADPGLADFFLGRLIAFSIRQAVTTDADERRMMGVAVFSTFLDCIDLGLSEQACKVIEFARAEMGPVEPAFPDHDAAA